MKIFKALFLSVSVFFGATHISSQSTIEGFGLEWTPIITDSTHIKRQLNYIYNLYPIPVVGASVFRSDSLYAVIARGKNRFPLGETITERNYFHLGSATQTITAWIASRMIQKGVITWETRFFDVFPKLRKKAHAGYDTITLEHLLSHKALLAPFASAAEFDLAQNIKGKGAKKQENFAKLALSLEPLKSPRFSNAGPVLAVMMLEKLSGKTYQQLLKEIVGKELGLSYYIGFPHQKSQDEPWGHWFKTEEDSVFTELGPRSGYRLPEVLDPALNLSMPFHDYTFFVQFTLYGLLNKHQGYPKELFEKICMGGMGWNHQKDGEITFIGNMGISGFSTLSSTIIPEMDLGMVLVSNTYGGPTPRVMQWLQERIFSKLLGTQPPPDIF
jgi:D-alanyl-D-alanine carboxypeptidase